MMTSRLLAVLLLCGFLTGCGSSPQTIAAHKIANALPQMIGPAQHYDVHVDGDAFALARGRARHVHIAGREVSVASSTVLDTLDVDAHDVSFDKGTKRIQKIGSIALVATIGQANLDTYLAHARALPGLTVTLREQDAEAEMPVSVLGLQTMVSVTGTLTPNEQESNKLDFIADGAHLGKLPLPGARLLLSQVNPLIDLSRMKVPIDVQQVEIKNNAVVLRGTSLTRR